ncbi:hypothetical protein JCM10369A_27570 [Nocardioides pyridinolyticus]
MPEPATGRRGLRGGDPDGGLGTAFGVAQERPGEPVEQGQRVDHPRGVRPPGVGRVDREVGPPPRQHRQQLDLGPLAAGVGGRGLVLAAEVLGVVVAQSLGVHPARRHEHHPPVAEPLSEQLGHQDRPEDVHGHRELVALRRLGALGRHHARVVHEDVDGSLDRRAERLREAAYVVEVADVAPLHVERRPRHPAGDPGGHAGALAGVAHDQDHLGAEPGQPLGRGDAQAAARAGDQRALAGHRARWRVGRPGRQPAAYRWADAGVAGHDRAVQHGVDGLGE